MYPLLQLCARIDPHPIQQKRLAKACIDFTAWDDLAQQAEAHGMAPLLLRQLSAAAIDLPNDFLRRLRLLALRHRQTNTLLTKALGNILSLLEAEGFKVLVLKGAALCHTLYPEPGLRPMRDIDLLLPWDQALAAHALLQRHGFKDRGDPTSELHLHLAALYKDMYGIQVCLELHRNLYPISPPHPVKVDFDSLYRNAESFTANGITVYTLGAEDMLWHLYQHGFHAPLTYDPFKLVSAADIIGFVEARLETIDWDQIQSEYPHLLAALPHLHHFTPWNNAVRERLGFEEESTPTGVGASFTGWPRRKLAALKGQSLRTISRDTFLPPEWWLRIYYAPTGRLGRLRVLLIEHPRHVFWWVNLYWGVFLQAALPEKNISAPMKLREIWTVMRNCGRVVAAMWLKIK